MTPTLDQSLNLHARDTGAWRARSDRAYEAANGMLGGWTAALLARGALSMVEPGAMLSALTVSFIRQVPVDADLHVSVQSLGATRSITHSRVDLLTEERRDVAATALAVTSKRRAAVLSHTEPPFPEAPEPEGLKTFHPPGRMGERADVRFVVGAELLQRETTESLMWVKETTGRALDEAQLAYLADLHAPVIFAVSSFFRPSATLNLTLQVHATPEELAVCGDDFVLMHTQATRIEESTAGARSLIWSRRGALLASTEQLCWYK